MPVAALAARRGSPPCWPREQRSTNSPASQADRSPVTHDILHIARDVAALLITVGGLVWIGGIIGWYLRGRAFFRSGRQLREFVDEFAADDDILRNIPFKPVTKKELGL